MSVPDISIRLEVLPGDTMAEQIGNAAKFGFDAIALPGRFKDRWISGLRECLTDSPLPMASISLGFVHSLISPGEQQRQECRDSILRLLDLCVEFGAQLLNVPPCLIQDNPERIHDAGDFGSLKECLDDLLISQLRKIGEEAAARDVMFLLEPVNKYESEYMNSIVHAAEIVQLIGLKSVGATADFFHMQMEELNTADALRETLPAIRHVHVAENTRVEPGPGSLDFRPGFDALHRGGYEGLIEVECRYLSGPADEVLPKSVAHLREQWGC